MDDDAVIRTVLSAALADEGYNVMAAADELEALADVDRVGAAQVLFQMRLSVMDGPAYFAALRQRSARPPGVIAIAAATIGLALAHTLGADAALTKPLDAGEVLALIALLLPNAGSSLAA